MLEIIKTKHNIYMRLESNRIEQDISAHDMPRMAPFSSMPTECLICQRNRHHRLLLPPLDRRKKAFVKFVKERKKR